MKITFSDHFNYSKLLRFVLPSVVMMVFTSIYGVVDGLFVSNYVGKTPFAAVNLIMPVLMLLGTVGFMIGTGGSAVIAKTLGEGNKTKANQYFSMLVYASAILGVIFAILGFVFIRPISIALGAHGEMLDNCVLYSEIILIALPAFVLQNVFQSFLVTAEKPQLGLIITVSAGITNIVFDYLFIAVFKMGISGAAAATALSQVVGGGAPVIYFMSKNTSGLKFTKTKFFGKIFLKSCTNGSSELLTTVSMSLVNILYNFRLMEISGENGIAAYGVIMYVNFIFASMFIGYSIGSAPLVSYNYGSGNKHELKNLFKKSIVIVSISGTALSVLALFLSETLSGLFVGYDKDLFDMTVHGFKLYSLSFFIMGINIFASAFFTALNNGLISGIISFMRTLVFQVAVVIVLPLFLGIDGIWSAVFAAELLELVLTVYFFISQNKNYKYV
jgi:putative MATE family efflux protein